MTTPPSHQAETFKCPQCSAPRMDYDPSTGGLKCPQCGFAQNITAAQTAIVEHDLKLALNDQDKAKGYGREMKAVVCKSCGATTQYDPTVASGECPFCGSQQVLEQKPDPNLIQPEAVIPFRLTKDQAYDNYKKWLAGGWFRPKNVLQESGATQLQGVYIPFWTFDAHAESDWTAESGQYYYETERYTTTENGKNVTKTRQVQRTRWYPSSGHHADNYDDVLISGSTSGDQNMLQQIYPFDTKQLLPYKSDYLSGWAAEAYRIPLAEAWPKGQLAIQAEERTKCGRLVPGDTYRNLQVSMALSKTTFKHVLLPVFFANYRYNTKLYHFMVNGQTGEVQGQAPIDWVKVAIVVAIAVVLLIAALYVVNVLDQSSSGGLHPVMQWVWIWVEQGVAGLSGGGVFV